MTYRIEGEWLVDDVNECTCGGSGILSPAHQPGCGSEPVAKVEDLLRDHSLLILVKQALLEGGQNAAIRARRALTLLMPASVENFSLDERSIQWTTGEGDHTRFRAEWIVNWILANGGEAHYEAGTIDRAAPTGQSARIAIRTRTGWAHAEPGNIITKLAVQFTYDREGWNGGTRCREFRIGTVCHHTSEEGCDGHGDF